MTLNYKDIAQDITKKTDLAMPTLRRVNATKNGANDIIILHSDSRSFFVKINRAENLSMYEAEAAGLQALRKTSTVRVPDIFCTGVIDDKSYIATEYLDLHPATIASAKILGRQLAQLHQHHNNLYGWKCDNTIGMTPQVNAQGDSWIHFWRDNRLYYQLRLARENGAANELLKLGQRVTQILPTLLQNYHPQPSLLHGDLWSGNWASTIDGCPVIFDPAVYYGDRETDIAMTELFGGFPSSFYAAYNQTWPLSPGYTQRKYLYQLYHILNHFNLFGGHYEQQAQTLMVRLLNLC